MWKDITVNDRVDIDRFVDVMRPFTPHRQTPCRISNDIKIKGDLAFLFQGPQFELVVRYRFIRRFQRHYIWNVGAKGQVGVLALTPLLIAKSTEVCITHGIDSLRVITTDGEPGLIYELIQEVESSPLVNVSILEQGFGLTLYEMQLINVP